MKLLKIISKNSSLSIAGNQYILHNQYASNQLINLNNLKSNEIGCKEGSNRERSKGNCKNNSRINDIPYVLSFNPFVNKCFIICVTIFSILLPIGIQPQLQFNYAFAEINYQSINDEVEDSDENESSSYLSTSESESKLNVKNPAGSPDEFKKNVMMNFIIPDIVEPDFPVGQTDTANSNINDITNEKANQDHIMPGSELNNSIISQSNFQSQLSSETYKNRDQMDAADFYSSNDSIIASEDKVGSELNPIDPQNYTANNSTNSDTNEKANQDVIIPDKQTDTPKQDSSASSGSYSQSNTQPKYKSYRDFMDQNDTNVDIKQKDIETEINPVIALNHTETQIATTNNNTSEDRAINTNNIRITVPADKSKIESSSAYSASSQLTAESSNEVYGDFNGDGFDDLAIGVPGEDLDTRAGAIGDAGAVNVIYGSSNGLSATSIPDQYWTQSSSGVNDLAESGDQFGYSLSAGDFNGDGKDDLAIGVPFENLNTGAGLVDHAGAVNVLYGSSNGLSATSIPDQFWTQSSTGVNDLSEVDDNLGFSLSAADFNGDGRDDLAIGVPGEDVNTGAGRINNAGAVNVIYGSSSGLSATSSISDQFWTQSSADVDDVAEVFDHFGESVSAGDFNGDGKDDLAIAVPNEGVAGGTIFNAGGVNVLYGSSNGLSATSPRADQFWTQSSADVDDSPEINDFFGSSLSVGDFNGDGKDDLAIGVSLEGVDTASGTIGDAGAVNVIYGSSNGLSATSPRADQFWTQSSADVDDESESNDSFGYSLFSGDFNDDGFDDLAVGVPGEDVDTIGGTLNNAGAVNVLYGSSNGLSATSIPDQFWTQSSTDVKDSPEHFDNFGLALLAADFNGDDRDDLAIGVPLEDVDTIAGTIEDAGAVNVIYGSSNGLSATSPIPNQFWTQSSSAVNDLAESGDNFGMAIG